MLLASIPRGPGDHRCHATPIFKWGSLVRLISWPAHLNVAQQGRLQTRSLFTRLPSPRSHHLRAAVPPSTGPPQPFHFTLDTQGKSLQTALANS